MDRARIDHPVSSSAELKVAHVERMNQVHSRISREDVRTACLVAICVLLAGYSLYFTRAIMVPVTIAIILSFVLSPLVNRLEKLKNPTTIGAGIVIASLVSLLAFGVYRLQQPAAKWVADVPEIVAEPQGKLRHVREPAIDLAAGSSKVEELAAGDKSSAIVKVDVQQPSLASVVLSRSSAMVASGILALTLLFFLLASGDIFLGKCVEWMPTFNDKRRIVETVRYVQDGIGNYLGTVTIINILLGIVIGITLWLFGVPNAPLWGVMATLLNYVPFVGLIVGTAVIILVSLLTFDTMGQAAAPAIAYLAINSVEANLITPSILGRSMSMNPVAILLWMTLWGWMWGIVGAILAVPLFAVLKIASDEFDPLAPIAKFISA